MATRRILLVDDDIAEISSVKRVLARLGLQPVLATNASDAMASIAQAAPELVLVGATCENGGGVALTRALLEDGATRAIPVVLLGESPDAAPGTAQLPRPIDPGVLAEQVKGVLGAPRGESALPSARAPQPAPSRPAPPRLVRPQPPPATAPAARPAAPPRGAPPGPAPQPPPGDRRAAAEALRARAEELRRGASPRPAAPPPDRAVDPADALAAAALPVGAELALAEPPPIDLGEGLDELLRRAEEAERARAAERQARARQQDRATVEAAQRVAAERLAIEKAARAREAEAHAARERLARAEAEAERAAEERRSAEAAELAEEATRLAEEQARRVAEAARAAADEARRAEDEARRAVEAEEKARAEAEARRRAEDELDTVRRQLETERRSHEHQLKSVLERAEAEEEAAAELRRAAEEEARAEAARRAAEEAARHEESEAELRRAIESARAELEALRRRSEEEARRRAEAEAELARVADARESERLAAERAAIARAPEPEPDPAQEAARRRAQAARERRHGGAPPPSEPAHRVSPEPGFEPPSWLEPARTPVPGAGPAAFAPLPAAPAVPEEDAPAAELPLPPPELRTGNLEDLPAPRLLALAARARLSGRVDVAGQAARSIWFEEGRVVGAASAAPGERVDEVALRLGLLTRDQHRQVAGAAASLPTRHAAKLLLERGYLKPTELTGLVRRRTEEVLFALFVEEGAAFRWAAAEVPPEERIALEHGPLALALDGVRRRWLAPRVDAVLGGPGTLVAPVAGGPALAEFGLGSDERRPVALADGLRTVDEIVTASALDPLSTRQVLCALVLTGALAVRIHHAGRPASAAAAAIDLARVREKLDQVRRADYFTILGVGRHATPHEVREAAARLGAEFDPARYASLAEDGLPARLEEIRRVIGDAREVLADDALRQEYVDGLGR